MRRDRTATAYAPSAGESSRAAPTGHRRRSRRRWDRPRRPFPPGDARQAPRYPGAVRRSRRPWQGRHPPTYELDPGTLRTLSRRLVARRAGRIAGRPRFMPRDLQPPDRDGAVSPLCVHPRANGMWSIGPRGTRRSRGSSRGGTDRGGNAGVCDRLRPEADLEGFGGDSKATDVPRRAKSSLEVAPISPSPGVPFYAPLDACACVHAKIALPTTAHVGGNPSGLQAETTSLIAFLGPNLRASASNEIHSGRRTDADRQHSRTPADAPN